MNPMFRPRPPRKPAYASAHLALLLTGSLFLAGCQTTRSETGLPEATAERASIETPAPTATALARDICLASAMVPDTAPGSIAEEMGSAPMQERRFAVPCPEQMDDAFMATLQRALIVRGYHEGAVSGDMDAETTAAIRRYQRPRGLDSDILSLDAARSLGLVAVERGRH